MEKIGAEAHYSECPDAPFELFERTGDVREVVLYEWVVDVEADVCLFMNLLFFDILFAGFFLLLLCGYREHRMRGRGSPNSQR